ncbi:MAG: hypothetical protein WC449_01515 [Candidatus Paceibacterota bacterium]
MPIENKLGMLEFLRQNIGQMSLLKMAQARNLELEEFREILRWYLDCSLLTQPFSKMTTKKLIIKYYGIIPNARLAKLLGLTEHSLRQLAYELRSKKKMLPESFFEDVIAKELTYITTDLEALAQKYKVSLAVICNTAKKLYAEGKIPSKVWRKKKIPKRDRLTNLEKKVLELCQQGGLSYEQIAALAGTTKGTIAPIKTHLRKLGYYLRDERKCQPRAPLTEFQEKVLRLSNEGASSFAQIAIECQCEKIKINRARVLLRKRGYKFPNLPIGRPPAKND